MGIRILGCSIGGSEPPEEDDHPSEESNERSELPSGSKRVELPSGRSALVHRDGSVTPDRVAGSTWMSKEDLEALRAASSDEVQEAEEETKQTLLGWLFGGGK